MFIITIYNSNKVPQNGIGRDGKMKRFLYALMVVLCSFFLVVSAGADENEAIEMIPDYNRR